MDTRPAIYSASKIWNAEKWRHLRDNGTYNITSRWIDGECGTPDNRLDTSDPDDTERRLIWDTCNQDLIRSDLAIIYAEEGDDMRGAIAELGGMLATSCPVYLVGDCASFRAKNDSDAAYTCHPMFFHIYKLEDYVAGYRLAFFHYLENQAIFWAEKAHNLYLQSQRLAQLQRSHALDGARLTTRVEA